MARVNNKARLIAVSSKLSASVAGTLADFLEGVVLAQNAENIEGIETSTRKRRAKAEVEEVAPRRKRRAAKEEAPAEKPARRSRRAKAEEADEKPVRRTRKPKVEIELLAEDVTVEDMIDIMSEFEGEPVEGTLRDLKPLVEARGMSAKDFPYSEDGLTPKEKAEEMGMFLAACDALEAQIVATLKEDEDAMVDIIEDLELELRASARASTIAKAIIVAINEEVVDDEDADEDGDEGDEDEDAEEAAPVRRSRRAKAEVEDEKPARRGRRAAKEVEEDDLSDLDDLD